MLLCTRPKAKIVNQAKNSSYFQLISCVIIFLSLLTILQVFLIYNEAKTTGESLDILVQGQNSNGEPTSSDDSPSGDDTHRRQNNNSMLQRRRRNDFFSTDQEPSDAEISTENSGGSELTAATGAKLAELLPAAGDGNSSKNFLMTSGKPTKKQLENLGENTSETIGSGTMLLAASSRAGKLDKAFNLNDIIIEPIASGTNEDEEKASEEPDIRQPLTMGDIDMAEPDINRRAVRTSPMYQSKKPTAVRWTTTTTTARPKQLQTRDIERAKSPALKKQADWSPGVDDTPYESRDSSRRPVIQRKAAPPYESDDGYGMLDRIPDGIESLMNDQEDLAEMGDDPSAMGAVAQQPVENKKIERRVQRVQRRRISPPRKVARRKSSMMVTKDPDEDYNDDDMNLDDFKPKPAKAQVDSDSEYLKVAAGYHHSKKHHDHGHDHGKYYMYAKVPKKKSWEFGYKRGNKKHWIERHEKGHKNKFKTKVKWYDKKGKGKGVHIWDYNHHDKKKKHYG